MLRRHPDLRYLIVGEGEYWTSLERIIAERQLAAHVTLAGSVSSEALLEHYAIADVRDAAPATPERRHRRVRRGVRGRMRAGYPWLPAFQAALMCRAERSQWPGVDGEDVSAIAQAILRILEDEVLRDRLRRGGLTRVLEADCRDKAAQFLDLCRRLADGPIQSRERRPAK